jgi:anti-sigma B factor antagonist
MFVAHPLLTIESEAHSDAYVIRIIGELDLGGCPELESALQEAEGAQMPRIIVDLEGLTFIDSVGLGTILKASRRSASAGNRLQITRGRGQPAEILRLTGLEKVLPLADPSLYPAIHEAGDAPGAMSHGKATAAIPGARSMPDDANRPRTGEGAQPGCPPHGL